MICNVTFEILFDCHQNSHFMFGVQVGCTTAGGDEGRFEKPNWKRGATQILKSYWVLWWMCCHISDEFKLFKKQQGKVISQFYRLFGIVFNQAKGNAILQASLERRKQALHDRRLALEQDVSTSQIFVVPCWVIHLELRWASYVCVSSHADFPLWTFSLSTFEL